MREIRAFFSLTLFCGSGILLWDLFMSGFSWLVLLGVIISYLLAYYLWPKGKTDDNPLYELVELIVELPFQILAKVLRSLGRAFSRSDGGLDIDL